jgi:hypothetical protein
MVAADKLTFSLEVFVQSIDRLVVPCELPAVAFRYLDLPPLVVPAEGGVGTGKEGIIPVNRGKAYLIKLDQASFAACAPISVLLISLPSPGTSRPPVMLGETAVSLAPFYKAILRKAPTEFRQVTLTNTSVTIL